MKCDACNSTGDSQSGGMACFICNGTGFICNECGEPAEMADLCSTCADQQREDQEQ